MLREHVREDGGVVGQNAPVDTELDVARHEHDGAILVPEFLIPDRVCGTTIALQISFCASHLEGPKGRPVNETGEIHEGV